MTDSQKTIILPLPKKGDVKIYHIAGDFHSRHYCERSFNILLQYGRMLPRSRRNLILNGDFLDCAEFMERDKNFKKWIGRPECVEEYFLPALDVEIEWGNAKLDELEKVYDSIIWVDGNHEWRIPNFKKQYVDKMWPAYRHQFDLYKKLELRERGIQIVRYNDWIDIGDVSVTHGMYHGTTCLKKHYDACGRSVIFNHVHNDEMKGFIRRGNSVKSYSNPAMCDLNPYYMKNIENMWTKGFGCLRVKPNGHFNYHTNTIWDGELVLESGKILRG